MKVKGKERLFAIYEYLLEHKSAKVAELAEIFGVSEAYYFTRCSEPFLLLLCVHGFYKRTFWGIFGRYHGDV